MAPDVESVSSEKNQSTRQFTDSNLVTWANGSDPANPKNWSRGAKWTLTLLVSLYFFITLADTTMISPGLATINRELGGRTDQGAASQAVCQSQYLPMPLAPSPLAPSAKGTVVYESSNYQHCGT